MPTRIQIHNTGFKANYEKPITPRDAKKLGGEGRGRRPKGGSGNRSVAEPEP